MEWKCLNCGAIRDYYPYLAKKRKYCSTSCQLKFEYKTKKRNGLETTAKAHDMLRTKGHYKRDNSYLSNNHVSQEARKRLSIQRKGEGNPMFNKKPWNKSKQYTKKWHGEKLFLKLRKICIERDGQKCCHCGILKENTSHLHCDHIIPYRICKEHKLSNLQMLCISCHSKKTNRIDIYLLKNIPKLV